MNGMWDINFKREQMVTMKVFDGYVTCYGPLTETTQGGMGNKIR